MLAMALGGLERLTEKGSQRRENLPLSALAEGNTGWRVMSICGVYYYYYRSWASLAMTWMMRSASVWRWTWAALYWRASRVRRERASSPVGGFRPPLAR